MALSIDERLLQRREQYLALFDEDHVARMAARDLNPELHWNDNLEPILRRQMELEIVK